MQGLSQGDDQAPVAVSRGSPYFSAPALLISAGVHVLVLVVLMCFGGGSSVSDDKSPDASVPVETAEEKDGEAPSSSVEAKETKEVQHSAAVRSDSPVAGKGDTGSLDDLKGFPVGEPVKPKQGAKKTKPETRKVKPDREVVDSRPAPGNDAGEIVEYIVQKGDNLTKLAAAHGMTNEELAGLNGKDVKRFSRLWVGQKIKIRRK